MEGQVPCVGGWSPYLRYPILSADEYSHTKNSE